MTHWSEKHGIGWSESVERDDVRRELYAQAEARLALARRRLEEARRQKGESKPQLKLVGFDEEPSVDESEFEKPKRPHSGKRRGWNQVHEEELSSFTTPNHEIGEPIAETTDPRWVLAVRTAAVMEGSVVRPEDREKMIKMGKSFGMSGFDCNLVIAILQDQARRGNLPEYCPQLAHKQLQLIPLPRPNPLNQPIEMNRGMRNSLIITGILALEVFVLWMMFAK
ncbi:hypothetical protein JD969_03375 [Planctomycetota bacterium]|nr:hypothetical protein JD969_03375 [Planctomycetota bacterium]